MAEWQPIETAPKDGSVVRLRLNGGVRAYWDNELQTWVLCNPMHIESIRNPRHWQSELSEITGDMAVTEPIDKLK